jgi:aminoglycoside phosphotransferase (APT) family kinase protein
MTVRAAEVERIFARHGLGKVRRIERLHGGQLNSVYRVNGDLVLRHRDPTLSTGSLKREAWVLPRLAGRLAVPEVAASGTDDLLGEYLVETWLPGENLLLAWLRNPDITTREWWITQWAAAIRAIHEVRFPAPAEIRDGELRQAPSWRAYVEGRIRRRLDALMRVSGMDRSLIIAAERQMRRRGGVLEDGPFCLVHRDLHFGNVLVDGPRLSGIVDFELAEIGTPDYELDTIFRFVTSPERYLAAEGGAGASASRFASVWLRLRRAYPEPFDLPYLRERLGFYALDRAFSSLQQACSGRWGGEAAAQAALREIAEVLEGRYGPP